MQSSKVSHLRVAHHEGTGLKGLVSVDLKATNVDFRIADGVLIPAPNGLAE